MHSANVLATRGRTYECYKNRVLNTYRRTKRVRSDTGTVASQVQIALAFCLRS